MTAGYRSRTGAPGICHNIPTSQPPILDIRKVVAARSISGELIFPNGRDPAVFRKIRRASVSEPLRRHIPMRRKRSFWNDHFGILAQI
jgi:hypothetical protein